MGAIRLTISPIFNAPKLKTQVNNLCNLDVVHLDEAISNVQRPGYAPMLSQGEPSSPWTLECFFRIMLLATLSIPLAKRGIESEKVLWGPGGTLFPLEELVIVHSQLVGNRMGTECPWEARPA